jgi:hypothetical protein
MSPLLLGLLAGGISCPQFHRRIAGLLLLRLHHTVLRVPNHMSDRRSLFDADRTTNFNKPLKKSRNVHAPEPH